MDALQAEGANVHLVHPRGLNWEDRRVKNDYRDCCEMLDRMRAHRLPEAWIAPPPVRELRELVRHRAKLVAVRTGLKAQLPRTPGEPTGHSQHASSPNGMTSFGRG